MDFHELALIDVGMNRHEKTTPYVKHWELDPRIPESFIVQTERGPLRVLSADLILYNSSIEHRVLMMRKYFSKL